MKNSGKFWRNLFLIWLFLMYFTFKITTCTVMQPWNSSYRIADLSYKNVREQKISPMRLGFTADGPRFRYSGKPLHTWAGISSRLSTDSPEKAMIHTKWRKQWRKKKTTHWKLLKLSEKLQFLKCFIVTSAATRSMKNGWIHRFSNKLEVWCHIYQTFTLFCKDHV